MSKPPKNVIDSTIWTGDIQAEIDDRQQQRRAEKFAQHNPLIAIALVIGVLALPVGSAATVLAWYVSESPAVIVGSGSLSNSFWIALFTGLIAWKTIPGSRETIRFAWVFSIGLAMWIASYSAMFMADAGAPSVAQRSIGNVYFEGIAKARFGRRGSSRPLFIDEGRVSQQERSELKFRIGPESKAAWGGRSVCLDATIATGRFGFEFFHATPVFIRPDVQGEWLVGNSDRQECLAQPKPRASAPSGPRSRQVP